VSMPQMRAGLVGIVAGTEQVVLQMTAEGGDRRGVPVCNIKKLKCNITTQPEGSVDS